MEFYVKNTTEGLVPWGDSAYEAKIKLKLGRVYKVKVSGSRNVKFHNKYFALINVAWQYLDERQTAFFKENVELFRKTVEVAAGWCDRVYSVERKEWVDIPKSIAFDKMDEEEFSNLYERVKDVLFDIFLKHISVEEFTRVLMEF